MTDLINRDALIENLKGAEITADAVTDVNGLWRLLCALVVEAIEEEPAVELVPRPSKCIDGVIQEHDNGMVSMTKTTWEDTKATLERYKSEIEDFYIAGYKKEHDGCDGCQYEPYSEDQEPCTECCQNYTDEYTPKKDLVEVVRCAECKYKYPKDMDMFCRYFIGGPLRVSGYCWKGERNG